ncbi:Flp pilus assembly complex ATPase component TadA [bacterium]|nr:Flp pilus assembly complex ATPase component TadA [bacterium]
MVRKNATDMHISAGSSPLLRIDGKLIRMPMNPISEELSKILAYSLMSSSQRRKFETELDCDFSIGIKDFSRFRCNVYHQKGSIAIAVKSIPIDVKAPENLHIPQEIYEFGGVNAGLVLIAGPRASGKSTTLSSLLNKINEERKQHILSIEDPLELLYNSKNCIINQRELYRDTKSYDVALASAPRQNADIIFVSEANDEQKLLATLKVADMGLLVFATIRARDAVSSMMRLIDLDLPPYLINGALRVIMAQRLLRMICPYCKRIVTPDYSLLHDIGIDPKKVQNIKFYRGSGCPKCNGTGFQGRIPIFEILYVTPRIKTMVQAGTSIIELWKDAVNGGMVPMRKVALKYMLEGLTTLEQVATETVTYQ